MLKSLRLGTAFLYQKNSQLIVEETYPKAGTHNCRTTTLNPKENPIGQKDLLSKKPLIKAEEPMLSLKRDPKSSDEKLAFWKKERDGMMTVKS